MKIKLTFVALGWQKPPVSVVFVWNKPQGFYCSFFLWSEYIYMVSLYLRNTQVFQVVLLAPAKNISTTAQTLILLAPTINLKLDHVAPNILIWVTKERSEQANMRRYWVFELKIASKCPVSEVIKQFIDSSVRPVHRSSVFFQPG